MVSLKNKSNNKIAVLSVGARVIPACRVNAESRSSAPRPTDQLELMSGVDPFIASLERNAGRDDARSDRSSCFFVIFIFQRPLLTKREPRAQHAHNTKKEAVLLMVCAWLQKKRKYQEIYFPEYSTLFCLSEFVIALNQHQIQN